MIIIFYVEAADETGLEAMYAILEDLSADPESVPSSLFEFITAELEKDGIEVGVVGVSFTAPVRGEKQIEVPPIEAYEFPYMMLAVYVTSGLVGTFLLVVLCRWVYRKRVAKYRRLERKRQQAIYQYQMQHAWTQTPGGWYDGSPPPSEGQLMTGVSKVHPFQTP